MKRAILTGFVALGLIASVPRAKASPSKNPRRLAWAGLAGGPLSPARAQALEALLLDEIDGYDSFRVVDAAGNALDDRLLALEASRAAKLFDEGVDALLHFKHKKAIQRLDQAIEVFESKLTSLRDHELLHDTLLAKAEALNESGKTAAALETLRALAVLSPKKTPNKRTHPAKFVALWEQALGRIGAPGRLQIEADEPTCTLLLDGNPLGSAPQLATRVGPGKHYVAARWPFFVMLQSVQVVEGREARVTMSRDGPAERARVALLDVIVQRQGADAARVQAKKVSDIAAADGTLVATVKSEGGAQSLLLARHDQDGRVEAIARLWLVEGVDSQATSLGVRKLGAAMFIDKRAQEIEVTASGDARPASGLAAALYGRGTGPAIGAVEVAAPVGGEAAKAAVGREAAKAAVGREAAKAAVGGRGVEASPASTPALSEASTSARASRSGSAAKAASLSSDPIGTPPRLSGVDESGDRDRASRLAPPIKVEASASEDRPITKAWWFWVGVGVGMVGLGVLGGALLFRPSPSSTTIEVVLR